MTRRKVQARIRTSFPGKVGVSVMLACSILLIPALAANKHKPTYHVLHKFTGGDDGGNSYAGLIRDAQGNLYGTTEYGGAFDYGTVFKLDPSGKETVIHAFAGGEGMWPAAALVQDTAGNLYGTTTDGGTPEGGSCLYGCGTVFKIDSAGKYTVLYAFSGGSDGGEPASELIMDKSGNLYGTTVRGGRGSQNSCPPWGSCGVVFKVNKHGKETVLYSFTGGADGYWPSGGLVRDNAGNLYGATQYGGTSDWGTIFMLDPQGQKTVLYNFTDGTDGGQPIGSLVRDEAGNLYGAANFGGDPSCNTYNNGCGVVFKLDTSGHETALYAFTGVRDGGYPYYGGLLRDRAGALYGTTIGGFGGTLFKLGADGKFYLLHTFGGSIGSEPFGGVIMDKDGNLYGTASQGGDSGCHWKYGCGVVYKLTP